VPYRKRDRSEYKRRPGDWTPEQVERLRRGCAAREAPGTLAAELGKTPLAIIAKATAMGVKPARAGWVVRRYFQKS